MPDGELYAADAELLASQQTGPILSPVRIPSVESPAGEPTLDDVVARIQDRLPVVADQIESVQEKLKAAVRNRLSAIGNKIDQSKTALVQPIIRGLADATTRILTVQDRLEDAVAERADVIMRNFPRELIPQVEARPPQPPPSQFPPFVIPRPGDGMIGPPSFTPPGMPPGTIPPGVGLIGPPIFPPVGGEPLPVAVPPGLVAYGAGSPGPVPYPQSQVGPGYNVPGVGYVPAITPESTAGALAAPVTAPEAAAEGLSPAGCDCGFYGYNEGTQRLQQMAAEGRACQVFQVPSANGPLYPAIVAVCPPGSCSPDPAFFAKAAGGVWICGAKSGSTPPLPPPVPPPPPPPAPVPPVPQPPPEQPCLKICGWPPPREEEPGEDEKPPPFDKCGECVGNMYFNKKTCKLAVFIEGCGPPRTELDDWVELGSSADPATLLDNLRKNRCLPRDPPSTPPAPVPPGPRVPGAGVQSFCDFLPPAVTATDVVVPNVFGLGLPATIDLVCAALNALPGIDVTQACNKLKSVVGDWSEPVRTWVKALLTDYLGATGCSDPRLYGVLIARALFGLADRWVSSAFGELSLPIDQQARYACPTGIPTPTEATAAWLSHQIDDATWRCWVRAGNQDDAKYSRVALAARSRLSADQLAIERARGTIQQPDWRRGMRGLGWVSEAEQDRYWDITEMRPGPADIIRMMLRDADDDAIAGKFKTDSHFDVKFQAKLRQWATDQRIPEDVMRYLWRSHWEIPSPTALFEMYRRARHKLELWPSRDPKQDVSDALIMQDILPVWHELYFELQFRPVTRVDARRMLELGIIDQKEAEEFWSRLGYDDDNARRLAGLAKQGADNRATKHSVVKRVAKGELSEIEAIEIMESEGFRHSMIDKAMNRAKLESSAVRRKACVSSLRKRYLLGEFGTSEAAAYLVSQGVGLDESQEIARGWECDRASRGKQAPAATLSQWYEEGIIDRVEAYERLTRLGFSSDDAVRVLRYWDIKLTRRRTLEEQRRLEKQIREQKAEQKERERDARALEAELAKGASIIGKAQREARYREKGLTSIASNLADRWGVELPSARQSVNAVYGKLYGQGVATQREVIDIMKAAADRDESLDVDSLYAASLLLLSLRLYPAAPPTTDLG